MAMVQPGPRAAPPHRPRSRGSAGTAATPRPDGDGAVGELEDQPALGHALHPRADDAHGLARGTTSGSWGPGRSGRPVTPAARAAPGGASVSPPSLLDVWTMVLPSTLAVAEDRRTEGALVEPAPDAPAGPAGPVAVVGLGAMGAPVVRYLRERPRRRGPRPTPRRACGGRSGAEVAGLGRRAARASASVAAFVPSDDDVLAVCLGEDGVLAGAAPGGGAAVLLGAPRDVRGRGGRGPGRGGRARRRPDRRVRAADAARSTCSWAGTPTSSTGSGPCSRPGPGPCTTSARSGRARWARPPTTSWTGPGSPRSARRSSWPVGRGLGPGAPPGPDGRPHRPGPCASWSRCA